MRNKAAQSKAWATVQIARHPERPQYLDYVGEIFTEFDALHGDRLFGDDGAMVGGLLLGLIESLGAGYLGDLTNGVFGSNYQDIFAFMVLILVLVFRPAGLLGERVAHRA